MSKSPEAQSLQKHGNSPKAKKKELLFPIEIQNYDTSDAEDYNVIMQSK